MCKFGEEVNSFRAEGGEDIEDEVEGEHIFEITGNKVENM